MYLKYLGLSQIRKLLYINIRGNVVDCMCINTNSGYTTYTFFVADYYDIKDKYAVIDFQDLDVRFLPKLKALLYEPILDEHWKKL